MECLSRRGYVYCDEADCGAVVLKVDLDQHREKHPKIMRRTSDHDHGE